MLMLNLLATFGIKEKQHYFNVSSATWLSGLSTVSLNWSEPHSLSSSLVPSLYIGHEPNYMYFVPLPPALGSRL